MTRNSVLSSFWLPQRRFCHGPKVSRREARRGSLSHANSNFNGKMYSSNSFELGFLADHREKAN